MSVLRIIPLYISFIFINIVIAKFERNHLIRQYVENERKPAHLILINLCWERDVQVNLVKEMSGIGISTATSMKDTSKYHNHFIVFIADLDCPKTIEILANASMNNLIRSPYRWLVFSEISKDEENVLEELPLLPDSDWVLAKKEGEVFLMTEIHKASEKHSLQLNQRGFFNGSFTDVRSERELFQRRKNLQGYTIMMVNMIQDSNSTIYHMEDELEPEFDFTTKVSWWIVKILAEMLNAKVDYKLSWRWGYKINGQWDGMINKIHLKEADLGTNCYAIPSRLEVITYADTLVPFRITFIFRQPPLSYVSNIFYLPFTARVWIAILICTITSCLALYFATKFESELETSATQLDGSMNDAILVTMSAVSQQGSLMEPKKASGRITIIVQFITLMALYVAYSANIVVLLQAPSNSIKTLPQLSDSKLTLAAHKLDYNYYALQFYNDSLHQGIYKRINPVKGKTQFYDIDEGVQRIKQGLFAFHSLVDLVYRRVEATFFEKEKCDLMEVDFFNGLRQAIPIQKHSPYLELFKVQFKRIREAGIQNALNKRFQVPKPICNNQAAFNSVGLLDIRGVIIMLLYGFALSIFTLVVEIIIFKISKNHILTAELVTHLQEENPPEDVGVIPKKG